MLNADLNSALRLYRDFEAGDPSAIAEGRDLFAATEPCFLCDSPVGRDFSLFVAPDPKRQKMALLAALCASCMALTYQERLRRCQVMMKAMFGIRVRPALKNELRKL